MERRKCRTCLKKRRLAFLSGGRCNICVHGGRKAFLILPRIAAPWPVIRREEIVGFSMVDAMDIVWEMLPDGWEVTIHVANVRYPQGVTNPGLQGRNSMVVIHHPDQGLSFHESIISKEEMREWVQRLLDTGQIKP